MVFEYYGIATIRRDLWEEEVKSNHEIERDWINFKIIGGTNTILVQRRSGANDTTFNFHCLYREEDRELIRRLFDRAPHILKEQPYIGNLPEVFYKRVYKFDYKSPRTSKND